MIYFRPGRRCRPYLCTNAGPSCRACERSVSGEKAAPRSNLFLQPSPFSPPVPAPRCAPSGAGSVSWCVPRVCHRPLSQQPSTEIWGWRWVGMTLDRQGPACASLAVVGQWHYYSGMEICIYVCMSENLYPAREVTVAPRSQTNRNVFSAHLNRSVDKSAERREDGRLFQILAPATAKLRSPNVLLVRRTTNIAVSDDRSVRRPESAMSWQSSARYVGSWPSRDLWISSASLNSTRWRTGSAAMEPTKYWRLCSRQPVPVTRRRAAAFWMPCNRWNRSSVMPKSSELQ